MENKIDTMSREILQDLGNLIQKASKDLASEDGELTSEDLTGFSRICNAYTRLLATTACGEPTGGSDQAYLANLNSEQE